MGVRLHAIMVRYTPALWAFSILVPMVPALGFIRLGDPAIWFATVGFILAGLVFIYDALTIMPSRGQIAGVVATGVLFIIGIANIIFGMMIYLGYFNPFVGSSPWTAFATVTLGLGVFALFVSGSIELILIKMAGKEAKSRLEKM